MSVTVQPDIYNSSTRTTSLLNYINQVELSHSHCIYSTILMGFPYLGSLFFLFKNAPTPLYLSRDKTKGQSGKNITLTSTKIFPKK